MAGAMFVCYDEKNFIIVSILTVRIQYNSAAIGVIVLPLNKANALKYGEKTVMHDHSSTFSFNYTYFDRFSAIQNIFKIFSLNSSDFCFIFVAS